MGWIGRLLARWRLVAIAVAVALAFFGAGTAMGRYAFTQYVFPGPGDPMDTVSRLSAGVQVSEYTDLLGAPKMKRPVRESSMVEWIWRRPEFAVQAFVDNLGQVQMYTLTSLAPTFTPPIPMLGNSGGKRLRLGASKFDQIPISQISENVGVYPASAKYHYSEILGGGGAWRERYLILTKSWDGTGAPEPAPGVIDILAQGHGPCGFYFKDCKPKDPGEISKLARFRAGVYISGFSLTAPDFDPRSISVNRSPWLLDSACDVPHTCEQDASADAQRDTPGGSAAPGAVLPLPGRGVLVTFTPGTLIPAPGRAGPGRERARA